MRSVDPGGPGPAEPAAPERAAQATAPARTRSGPRATGVVVDGPDAPVRLMRLLYAGAPDELTGFTVRGGTVTVHRRECPAVAAMQEIGRAPVGARWAAAGGRESDAGCRVTLVAESFGRPRLLADLTEAIATAEAAIVSATVEPPSEQRVRHTYTLQLPDAAGLPALMRAMREVAGVYDVSRAQHPAPAG